MRDVSPDVLNDYFATLGYNATKHIQPRKDPLDCFANRCPQSIFLTPATDAEVISINCQWFTKQDFLWQGRGVYKLITKIVFSNAKPRYYIANKFHTRNLSECL